MVGSADQSVRCLGFVSGSAVAAIGFSYVYVLMAALITLSSSDAEIRQPWLALLEVLIIAIAPTMVLLAVWPYAQSSGCRKPFALAGAMFMSMCAATNSVVHFLILTPSHQAPFASEFTPVGP
jgi:biotin transporter BioY